MASISVSASSGRRGINYKSRQCSELLGFNHRLLSSSFLGLPYRILNITPPQKELLRSLWGNV